MNKVLVTDTFTPESLVFLQQQITCDIKVSEERQPSTKVLNEYDALLIRSRTQINEKTLGKTPTVKVIVTATSGFDHIDLNYCEIHNIKVAHTPEANAQSAAELTLFLILSCLKKYPMHTKAMQNGNWKDLTPKGRTLNNSTVGIVGLGKVGGALADLLQPFGIELCAYDPYKPQAHFDKYHAERVGYMELLAQSNIVTYHVPLTNETHHMINHQTLAHMNSQTILINASRGEVANEGELATALEDGVIAAAGLDVFEKEPLTKNSRLFSLPNVTLTPHIGAYTKEGFALGSQLAAEKISAFFKNQEFPCL